MPNPFPGMDPWLERPSLWPDVHDNLIIRLQSALAPLLRPRYYVAVQQRTVIAVVPPDPHPIFPDLALVERDKSSPGREYSAAPGEPIIVEVPAPETITEDYLEVVEMANDEVVTVIEILSPSNKRTGEDRQAYISKRKKIFRAQINLVEIDLLRDWPPMPFTFLQTNGHLSHYRILIKRGESARHALLYPFGVRDSIPIFRLPLQPGDNEPPVCLGEVLKKTYDECGYDLRIDYSRPPEPPLSDADAQWAAEILGRKMMIS
ncbi:MAG: DUF4058 family protein [candidate division KSB1 bacterium]|nr:DUF4058 family protein [candidate division KSB1 bacterium]MDZ7365266.1 DUF4058 family protein [candidate division KSB1 bacterium]MDZ7403133.1 DUF4058 family protein [candidate division KSB1 bacterium]